MKKENTIVALDFDGVIGIGAKAKIKYAKILHGINADNTQITKDSYPLCPEKYRELMDFVGSKAIMEFELAPGCKEVLEKLYAMGFRFVVVSSRFSYELDACKRFCRLYKLPIEEFYNTNETSKNVLCSKLKIEAIIDDSLHKLAEIKNKDILKFYFNAPWNTRIRTKDKNFINVKSWDEFYEKLIKQL